ncbi:pilus assembly protein PilP [Pseudomonas alkylphenolica]|uniref:pilus assembly protein PilP n=1 Tax=Pseudomonas alkylphenolica TaxID=237609 RepID=UPI0018D77634|nr:pilus assembly protein PilP [Pseudomonas alkylphenolica]MBH3429492.1 pilus assembly protein PilP [Pseudomonas alkylphenolica]
MAVCLVLMLGLAFVFHLRSLFLAIEIQGEQAQRLRLELAEKAPEAQQRAAGHARLMAAQLSLEVEYWRLAAGGELAGLVEDIAYQGQSHGVFVEQMELIPEVLHDHHIEMPIQLRVRGTYAALSGFSQGLAQLPRLIIPKEFDLIPTEEQGPASLQLQVRISAYRSREQRTAPTLPELAPALARPVPGVVRSPFEPAPLTQQRQYLETLPLDQFEMIGSLARRQVRHALLRVGRVVHRLQVGDRLGRDNGRVTVIEEHKVEIAEKIFVPDQGWVERQRTLRLKSSALAG